MIVTVICTGESLTQADVDYCRGKCKVIAVSDAIYLAPWADALVSHDRQWWAAHPEADCALKFTAHPEKLGRGIERFTGPSGNSGALGIRVAAEYFGATKILVIGLDGRGSHYFGAHTREYAPGKALKNTRPDQFETHAQHFARLKHLPVVNCTPGTAVKCFRKGDLRAELADLPSSVPA